MSENEQILDRIEAKLDIAILVSQGVPREEAEARVYWPRIVALVEEIRAAADRIDQHADRLTKG